THLWQYLALLQRSGHGHNDPELGKQSLFFPACPQSGLNLPDDWEQVYPK
ncbi:hypothetical protein PAXRUDRAFT_169763, partial [Paxillus rubicundulus Ve08.2h10]